MLDFGTLEKAQAAIDAVGNAGVEQSSLNHPALRIAAVEHGDFGMRIAFAQAGLARLHQVAHFRNHPLCFFKVAGRLINAHRFARPLVGAQVFAQAAAVVADQRIGRVQNVAVAAVVLLQLDLVLHRKFAHKVGHIAHACAAKRINALVIIADRQHRSTRARAAAIGPVLLARQHLDPGVLQFVGVLKLVDQDVTKAPLVMLADGRVVAQHFITAQHQLAKVHHAFALALLFIELVKLSLTAGIAVAHWHILRAHALFFAVRNKPTQLLGREAVFVHRQLLAQALDGAELVLRVQNLKGLRQGGGFEMRPQKAVAQAVERANPHATHRNRQHGRQAGDHLFGSFVGKSDRQNAAGVDMALLQEPGDTSRQHPGFSRTRPSQDQRMLRR